MSTDKEVFVYRINSRDEIYYTSGNWDTFALENGGLKCQSEYILGRKIWEYIDSVEIRQLYHDIAARVLQTGKSATIPINCDSPALRREMLLTVVRLPGNEIEYRSQLIRTIPREPIDLLQGGRTHDGTLLQMCCYCKSIAVSAELWLPTELAIVELDLFHRESLPGISHGVCPACYEIIMNEPE